jgi:hypothetical protein
MHTVEEAKQWAADNEAVLRDGRALSVDDRVVMLNREAPESSRAIWEAGSWLEIVLHEAGATDREIIEAQKIVGTATFLGHTWEMAVHQANLFEHSRSPAAGYPETDAARKQLADNERRGFKW